MELWTVSSEAAVLRSVPLRPAVCASVINLCDKVCKPGVGERQA